LVGCLSQRLVLKHSLLRFSSPASACSRHVRQTPCTYEAGPGGAARGLCRPRVRYPERGTRVRARRRNGPEVRAAGRSRRVRQTHVHEQGGLARCSCSSPPTLASPARRRAVGYALARLESGAGTEPAPPVNRRIASSLARRLLPLSAVFSSFGAPPRERARLNAQPGPSASGRAVPPRPPYSRARASGRRRRCSWSSPPPVERRVESSPAPASPGQPRHGCTRRTRRRGRTRVARRPRRAGQRPVDPFGWGLTKRDELMTDSRGAWRVAPLRLGR
jgi:hypothetical protein